MAGRSRYDGAPVATVQVADGAGTLRDVAYLLARTPRDPGAVIPMAWHRVGGDDRVDLVADRYLGDPQAWWRICDANSALDPDALIGPDNEGAVVVIGVPEA
ncbi:MAG: LysM domain-containing protein [Actinobacteria bacterium]|nr:LysM domain-containing protein [Actinomycetota bacterium]